MSYCLFQNIVIDLEQVIEKLEELESLSLDEIKEELSQEEFLSYKKFTTQIKQINILLETE
jgi:hypothetical protein